MKYQLNQLYMYDNIITNTGANIAKNLHKWKELERLCSKYNNIHNYNDFKRLMKDIYPYKSLFIR